MAAAPAQATGATLAPSPPNRRRALARDAHTPSRPALRRGRAGHRLPLRGARHRALVKMDRRLRDNAAAQGRRLLWRLTQIRWQSPPRGVPKHKSASETSTSASPAATARSKRSNSASACASRASWRSMLRRISKIGQSMCGPTLKPNAELAESASVENADRLMPPSNVMRGHQSPREAARARRRSRSVRLERYPDGGAANLPACRR